MIPIPLILPDALQRQIEADAEQGYPNECCGILIGRDSTDAQDRARRIVEKIEPARNAFAADEQRRRFSIDPRRQLQVEREAEAAGLAVLGFYHSHPDHPAVPSEYDRECAWPFYSYVIVSVVGGRAAAMTSWVLDQPSERFVEQAIVTKT